MARTVFIADDPNLAAVLKDVVVGHGPIVENFVAMSEVTVVLMPMLGHMQHLYGAILKAVLENVARIMFGELPLHPKDPEIEPAWRARLAAIDRQRGA